MLRLKDKSIIKKLKKYYDEVTLKYYSQDNITIRYIILNENRNWPTLVFIHGAPGYILDLKNYFQLPEIGRYARIIAIERPGYGYSNYGKPLTSISQQAQLHGKILSKENQEPALLVAHSYGGPIAAKIAIDHPQLVQKLFLLAPALDPNHEKTYKIAHLAKIPFLRKLIPTPLLVAAAEKFAHVAELAKLKPEWSNLKVPVEYFHGTNDWIVPYENLFFAQKHFTNTNANFVPLKGVNHFINYFPKKAIVDKIAEMLHK